VIPDEDIVTVLGRDKRLPEIVYVFELIRESCCIVQVDEFCRPETLTIVVEYLNGFARRAKQDFFAAYPQVVLWVWRIKDITTRRHFDEVFYQRARKAQAVFAVERAAARKSVAQDFWNRITNANIFEDVQRRVIYPLDVVVSQRAIPPAR
jgi:hypothetical protein